MSVVLQALALFVSQSASPFDRAESLLGRTDGFTSNVSVAVTKLGVATGSYSVLRPKLQRYDLKGAGFDETFLQGKNGTVYFDRLGKEFTWYPSFPVAVETPEEASPIMSISIPLLLAQGSLTKLAPKEKWIAVGSESVDGHPCDILAVPSEKVPGPSDPVRIWIDLSGRVLRMRLVNESPTGRITSLTDFINPTYSAPALSSFDTTVPWGYLPTKIQEQRVIKQTGERALLGKWTKLPSMETVEMNSVDPTLVLVTSDDLAPEPDLNRWRGLADRAKKAKVKFVQIWIGKKPSASSTEWESYWDKDGSFEADFGPPSTPYLMLIADKAVISAWQGWSESDEQEAATTLFSPLSRRR